MAQRCVALEITPPKSPNVRVLLRRAALLGETASLVNVVQRMDRQASLDACLALRASGFTPVWHLVTRGRALAEIERDLERAAEGGIERVLVIRGDHAADGSGASIRDTIALVRRRLPEAVIGATLNQHVPDRRATLGNLLPKLDAGATFVQTQPVFDSALLEPYSEALFCSAPEVKLLPMVMPLLSLDAAAKIEGRLRIELPEPMLRRLVSGEANACWKAFRETLQGLTALPQLAGCAVMTFETDARPDSGAQIACCLRGTGFIGCPTPLRAPAETATRR